MPLLLLLLVLPLQLSRPAGGGDRHLADPRPPGPPTPPNLLLITADDLGVDLLGAYGEAADPPCTPNLDALAAEGLLFRNAWANPVCSPTRAALLTGRHGFRTGIGSVVANTEAGLALAETTLPEALPGYESRAVGKWHLSGNSGSLHPNQQGFERFAGSLAGGLPDYFQWTKTVDGVSSVSTTYATTDEADEAVAALNAMQEPWFLYLNFHAPHTPFHVPPASLCDPGACTSACANLGPTPTNPELAKAMVEALDAELGRVLAALDVVDPNAFVFFLGDNGTARGATELPFRRNHAKGTAYEGGVNVPLLVRGPGVAVGETAALVHVVDLFATLTELAGVPAATEDSLSFVPVLADPSLAPRAFAYAETFSPNGGALPFASHLRAVRDERYKLIRETGAADLLYDLLTDPFEQQSLLPGLTTAQQNAYDALVGELVVLGVD